MHHRAALVAAITTDTRVPRWRLEVPALLQRDDRPAAAARSLLRRVYAGQTTPPVAGSALACLGFTRTAGGPYGAAEVAVAAALLVRLSGCPGPC